MEFIPTKIKGTYIIRNQAFLDRRGKFIKIYNEEEFHQLGLNTDFKEIFYTTSKKHTIRGMHFQNPPYDQEKLVYVTKGKILDVILDIRPSSPTFGEFISYELTSDKHEAIYVAKGCAHGYIALEEDSVVAYHVTSLFNKEADDGVRYDSFGMEWDVEHPILSDRDLNLLPFNQYKSLFK